MSRKAFVLCLLVLFPVALSAQWQLPQIPGLPQALQTVVVRDSAGTQVGEVLETVNGRQSVLVKYGLADGNYVVLRVDSGFVVGGSGISSPLTVQPSSPGASPQQTSVYFRSADCSGDLYLNLHSSIPTRGALASLTKRVPLVLSGVTGAPAQNSCPNIAAPPGGTYLYATGVGACPLWVDPSTPALTFQSAYGMGPMGPGCQPVHVTFGGTAPTSHSTSTGLFVTFHRIEDLNAKFRPPFHIP